MTRWGAACGAKCSQLASSNQCVWVPKTTAKYIAMLFEPPRQDYLTQTLRAIVTGHKQREIESLLPWNYAVKM